MGQPVTPPPRAAPVTRVCRACSAQSQSPGNYCPHCGKRFTKGGGLGRWILVVTTLVVLVALAAAAMWWEPWVQPTSTAAKQDVGHRPSGPQASPQEPPQPSASTSVTYAQEHQQRMENLRGQEEQRELEAHRDQIVQQVEGAIQETAQGLVAEGRFHGVIHEVRCDPEAGTNIYAPRQASAELNCMAVNEITETGVRGYRFIALVNWRNERWTYRLAE